MASAEPVTGAPSSFALRSRMVSSPRSSRIVPATSVSAQPKAPRRAELSLPDPVQAVVLGDQLAGGGVRRPARALHQADQLGGGGHPVPARVRAADVGRLAAHGAALVEQLP